MNFLKKIIVVLFLLTALIFQINSAQASAWWGVGARDKDWILKHGGSLFYYQIKGKASSDKYVVKMFLEGKKGAGGNASDKAKKGDLIETEYGSEAVFDDAINNKYKIVVYRNGDKEISTKITAVPGERTKILFDLKEDKTIILSREAVYKNYQIKLNSKSSKWISSSDLIPPKTEAQKEIERQRLQEIEEKKKKELEEQKKQAELEEQKRIAEAKQKEFQIKLTSLKEEIEPINKELEKRLIEEERKNKKFFSYIFQGPDKSNLEEVEKGLLKSKEKLEDLKKIKEDFGEKDELKKEEAALNKSVEKYSYYLNKNKKNLNFWNRLKFVFNMS